MTQHQRQSYLQARAASRIHAITTNATGFDNVSTVTNLTNFIPVPSQIAQASQANCHPTPSASSGFNPNASGVSNLPFGGQAAHRG